MSRRTFGPGRCDAADETQQPSRRRDPRCTGSTLVAMSSGDWRDRIERYLVPVDGQGDETDLGRSSEHELPANADEAEHSVAREVDQPTSEPGESEQRASERHLLFI